jgi:hypothetical protein
MTTRGCNCEDAAVSELGRFQPSFGQWRKSTSKFNGKKGYHILSHKPMFCPKSYFYNIYIVYQDTNGITQL